MAGGGRQVTLKSFGLIRKRRKEGSHSLAVRYFILAMALGPASYVLMFHLTTGKTAR